MNWETIMYSSAITLVIVFVLYYTYVSKSKSSMRNARDVWNEVQSNIEIGKEVLASGIAGKVKSLDENYAYLEIAEGVVIKVAKYAITKVF
jgi:preprotein translocase YajC subunit